MKSDSLLISVFRILGLAQLALFSTLETSAAPACGTVLATYKNVSAFSNGDDQGSGDPCIPSKGTYGWEYQCVEFVKRFYSQALGVNTAQWTRDAVEYFGTAAAKGLTAYSNGGTTAPMPDDIIVFSGGKYGHVAVVAAVTSTQIQIIEQNWSSTGTASLSLALINGHYNIADRGSYRILGWLRKLSPCDALDFNPVPPNSTPPGVYSVIDVGWAFTPAATVGVNGIQTRFSSTSSWFKNPSAPNLNAVTVELYKGIPSCRLNPAGLNCAGTTLPPLRLFPPTEPGAGDFTPAAGTYSGPTPFPTITLTAGTTYFVGFFNVQGLGTNFSTFPPLLPLYFDLPSDSFHSYSSLFGLTSPTVRFSCPIP